MEEAVTNMELMFQKADADLNLLSRRLEKQFNLEESKSGQPNPLLLMKEIESVKAEYSNIRQDIQGISAAQKEAVAFLRGQLATLSDVLLKLENQTGQQDPESGESSKGMVEELSQLLGVSPDCVMASAQPENSSNSSTDTGEDSPVGMAAGPSVTNSAFMAEEVKEDLPEVEPEPSAAERREASSEFVEVSVEEFGSVSELIRGRAKLEDVNKTYKLLWEHFKEQNNSDELTPKAMNAMGLRVTGATGQAKLKILRALKLCKISKSGGVTLS